MLRIDSLCLAVSERAFPFVREGAERVARLKSLRRDSFYSVQANVNEQRETNPLQGGDINAGACGKTKQGTFRTARHVGVREAVALSTNLLRARCARCRHDVDARRVVKPNNEPAKFSYHTGKLRVIIFKGRLQMPLPSARLWAYTLREHCLPIPSPGAVVPFSLVSPGKGYRFFFFTMNYLLFWDKKRKMAP